MQDWGFEIEDFPWQAGCRSASEPRPRATEHRSLANGFIASTPVQKLFQSTLALSLSLFQKTIENTSGKIRATPALL
jgi:hypothetical protein